MTITRPIPAMEIHDETFVLRVIIRSAGQSLTQLGVDRVEGDADTRILFMPNSFARSSSLHS